MMRQMHTFHTKLLGISLQVVVYNAYSDRLANFCYAFMLHSLTATDKVASLWKDFFILALEKCGMTASTQLTANWY